MIPRYLVEISMSENDKKLLIVLLVIAILLFILLGLIGMLIRYVMKLQGEKIDNYVAEPVRYRVLGDATHFTAFAKAVNRRLLFKQALVPWMIALLSLVVYIIYAAASDQWGRNYWGEFGTLFYQWDWANKNNYVTFWGMTLLAKWPDVLASPSWHNEYWISYILVPMWLTSIVYYLVVSQAFIARLITLNRRAHSIYSQSLENFNYYDSMPQNNLGQPGPSVAPKSQVPTNNANKPQ
jgi:hypothetical protein